MKDTTVQGIEHFKNVMFVWEIVITTIVFTGLYFFFKAYKNKEDKAKKQNELYETGSKD